MAFGTNKGERRPLVFLDLRTKAADPDGVGFRQVVDKKPNPDPNASTKWIYETAMHQFVEGRIVGFKVTEEPSYDDKTIMNKVANVRLADADAGPDVMLKFRLDGQHGRKLVGLLANALVSDNHFIHIKTNRAEAGDKIGDKVLEKPQAFVTANIRDAQGPRINPPYYIDSSTGNVRMDGEKVAELPRGVEVVVNKKKQYDFTKADEWVEETASVLQSLFEMPADNHEEAESGSDDGIDLNEAAAAAASPQA